MSTYGRDPIFGTFVTPTAAYPQQAVELAVLADAEGLDLVTFQDHPYQPAFLDTWTLMAFVAARTERIRPGAFGRTPHAQHSWPLRGPESGPAQRPA